MKKNCGLWGWIAAAVAVAALVAVVAVKIHFHYKKAKPRRQTAELASVASQLQFTGTVELPGNVKLELVKVEAGAFIMGKRDGENFDDEKEHLVTLTKDFYIGKTEVTQEQWKAVMGANPSCFKGDELPVENVSWNDAMEFCERLNEMGKAPQGWKFTLPTEAQWEYAARGGRKSRRHKYSGSENLNEVAWFYENAGDRHFDEKDLQRENDPESQSRLNMLDNNNKAHPVARKKENELGLYDMSGNVDEWCRDWYEKDYARDPEFLTGNSGEYRVIRGGNSSVLSKKCRLTCRFCGPPDGESKIYSRINESGGLELLSSRGKDNYLGFRVALVQIK